MVVSLLKMNTETCLSIDPSPPHSPHFSPRPPRPPPSSSEDSDPPKYESITPRNVTLSPETIDEMHRLFQPVEIYTSEPSITFKLVILGTVLGLGIGIGIGISLGRLMRMDELRIW
jgi:hypothetical protein